MAFGMSHLTANQKHSMKALDVLSEAKVYNGIKRTFFRDLALLNNGETASFDVLVANHTKHFPNLVYVVVTAVSRNQSPIGFRDISVNRVSSSDKRCFGSGSECIPHFVCKDWMDFERGVPYRPFRLGNLNPQGNGFMILESYENTGLSDLLVEVSNEIGKRMNLKGVWISELA